MSINFEELIFDAGKKNALLLQTLSDNMTGTELYDKEDDIPDFSASCLNSNMLDRKIGFICRSKAKRIVKLIQPYDSTIFTQEPEDLPAQWGFAWSTDPKKALPFISMATSPYMKDDCCTYEGLIYRSLMNNNVFSPKEYPTGWKIIEGDEI